MAREKIISSHSTSDDDEQFSTALRPTRLDECIGMGDLLEKLRISILAARQRKDLLCLRSSVIRIRPHQMYRGWESR